MIIKNLFMKKKKYPVLPILMSEGSLKSYGCLVSEKNGPMGIPIEGEVKNLLYVPQFSEKNFFDFFFAIGTCVTGAYYRAPMIF